MNKTLCKLLMIVPFVLFIDWVLMVIFGCVAGVCDATDKFFCTTYCFSFIALLIVSVGIAMYLVLKKVKA